ncbi:MAG: aminoglycoside N(3)-acetyltransferase [Candidatus Thorarchaeota archaeon]
METWEKEKLVVDRTKEPITKTRLVDDFKKIGLGPGNTVISHFAMSKIGWIVGREMSVIEALMEVLTEEGTLVMPSQTPIPGDPANWNYPPVPESWWQTIRDEAPIYDPLKTPATRLGRIPELFRSYPGVLRSPHPQTPFAAWGKHAADIVEEHYLELPFGKGSPLEKMYHLDAKVLLVGVGHSNNTALHFAEFSANIPNFPKKSQGTAMMVNGKRIWKTWEEIDYDSDDFHLLGASYEKKISYSPVIVGQAETRLFSMREMIPFAITWFEKNRVY